MVLADRTNKHGGSSANPPAASLYGEHAIIATNVPQLYPMAISDGRFWRKAASRHTGCVVRISGYYLAGHEQLLDQLHNILKRESLTRRRYRMISTSRARP